MVTGQNWPSFATLRKKILGIPRIEPPSGVSGVNRSGAGPSAPAYKTKSKAQAIKKLGYILKCKHRTSETPTRFSRSFGGTMKKLLLLPLGVLLVGCSATTLRCGISEGDSYVELINMPQDISGQSRNFENLCGFAYETEPTAKLNIIGAQ